MFPNGYFRHGATPRGDEPTRLVPALVLALALSLIGPALGWSTARGQESPGGTGGTAPGGTAPGSTAPGGGPAGGAPGETGPSQAQPPATVPTPPPFYVPQFPNQYPPAFQTPIPQVQPFGAPPVGTGIPGAPIPPWTPPIAPPPSQAHPPTAFPTNFAYAFGGKKTFELNPAVYVTEQWTDNFNQTATNKQTNYRTIVGPGGTLVINGPSTKGFITGNAGLTYDTAPNSSNFNVFPTITAGLQQIFSPRLSLSLANTYVRNNNPSYGDQFGLNTQRQEFTSNSASASLNYLIDIVSTTAYYRNSLYNTGGSNGSNTTANIIGLGASTQVGLYNTVSLGYEHSWSNTSGASAGSNEGQSTGNLVTASISRQTGTYSSAGIQGSYAIYTQPQQDNSYIWNFSVFSTYGFPSGLSFSGSVGVSQFSQNNQPTSTGATSNSSVSYTFGPATATLAIFSGFRQTGLDGQNFGVQQTQGYTGAFSYRFTPLITGSLQAAYTENSPTGGGNNANGASNKNLTAGANISWQILQWLSLNGNYNYLLRSNPNTGSISGSGTIPVNTATLTLGATF